VEALSKRLPAHLRDQIPAGYKCCPNPACQQALPLDHFWKSEGSADGRQGWCITCSQHRQKRIDTERRWYLLQGPGDLLPPGPDVPPPLPEAIPGSYTTQAGRICQAWFVELPTIARLREFCERYGPLRLECSPANPRIMILTRLQSLPAPADEAVPAGPEVPIVPDPAKSDEPAV
jgi:hypothetical protein